MNLIFVVLYLSPALLILCREHRLNTEFIWSLVECGVTSHDDLHLAVWEGFSRDFKSLT
jgi:hypothetical protein